MPLQGSELTIKDIGERYKGSMIGDVVMSLWQMNSALRHMVFGMLEAPRQEFEFHYQKSQPGGAWVHAHEGTWPEVAGITRAVERPGTLEMRNRTNDMVLRQAGDNANRIRYQEDMIFLQSMNQHGAATFYYGSKASDVAQFDGIASMLASKSRPNVYSANGSGSDLTSAYIVDWSKDTACTMFFPEGSEMGVEMIPLPMQTVIDSTNNNKEWEAHRSKFLLSWGFAIQNHRCVARYGDIEVSGNVNRWSIETMIRILNLLQRREGTRMYVSRELKTQIDIAALNKSNAHLTMGQEFGRPVPQFWETTVHVDDAISDSEDALAA